MKVTSVFTQNITAYNNDKRVIVNKGGTRSSKTFSILQLLTLIAHQSVKPLVISIVSETMPHLKKGCIRDFKHLLQTEGMWNDKAWNATDKVYKLNHSIIEFFSADQPAKVHGPARDILFVNECINISHETYRQLAIRTRGAIFLDFNPCHEFWVDEHVLPRAEAVLIASTYLDNAYLTPAQVQEIESNKHDTAWWGTYGLGETGSRQGLVVQNWDIVQCLPAQYSKRWLGIDFGFTNDPTAIVDIRLHEGELWMHELLCATGYDNPMIASFLEQQGISKHIPIVADSAEPKSIREIRASGWLVEPADKGRDSIDLGLSLLNRYVKHITQSSTNILREYRNYRWMTDDFGRSTNRPIDRYN
ncbi:MAG: hypothetical protein RL662_1461, partial [Bacteroidota bacterium]